MRAVSDEEGVHYSCVVPCYNEEGSLPLLREELLPVLRELDRPFELLIVDDGSTDKSPEILDEYLKEIPELVVYRLDRNWGLSSALDAGFRHARGEVVISLDSDLQNDPKDIPLLLEKLDEADMVLGWRWLRKDPFIKRLSSKIANAFRNMFSSEDVHDSTCPLKVFKRPVLERIKIFNGLHRFLPTMAKLEGFTITEVKVGHRERRAGTSKYGVWNRLFKGLSDLRTIRWMKKNTLRYKAERVRP
jgi:glycosyltransferase involved in cell wall biosynthesis